MEITGHSNSWIRQKYNRRNILYYSTTLIILLLELLSYGDAVEYKVTCSPKNMVASVTLPSPSSVVYLDNLKGYPVCRPLLEDGRAMFDLSLDDIYSCGTTRVYDRITGRKLFYHRIVIEVDREKKETILIKCDFEGQKLPISDVARPRRNVLPANFTEATDIETIATVVVEVPAPMVHVSVRQNGLPVDTQVNVQPGTPLEMDIALDKNSSDTYGLFVKDVKVTDNSPHQEEAIIQNGCSLDPYLFSNFITNDGDKLSATFRAFKFPDSSYVLFIGTVNVCLDQCHAIPCSNGQPGFGRRRRDLKMQSKNPNKIFEVTMTTIMRVGFDEGAATKEAMIALAYEPSAIQGAKFSSDNSVTINSDARSLTGNNYLVLFVTMYLLAGWLRFVNH